VRIVAALVNPAGPAPEHEQVTLLNTTPEPISLRDWRLTDGRGRGMTLTGILWPNQAQVIDLSPEVPLPNSGGLITLLNAQGLKVDGVAYTREQAREQGRTIVFGRS